MKWEPPGVNEAGYRNYLGIWFPTSHLHREGITAGGGGVEERKGALILYARLLCVRRYNQPTRPLVNFPGYVASMWVSQVHLKVSTRDLRHLYVHSKYDIVI